MTDQPQPSIGTVAEEAARLISAMATKARASADTTHDPSPYAGEPAQDPASPDTEHASRPEDTARPKDAPPERAHSAGPAGASSAGASSAGPSSAGPGPGRSCAACGGESDGTPVACRLCPLCQGIALLRSVRPETVDRLADLASAVATALREMATQSRASGPGPEPRSGSGKPSDGPMVQNIRVDDEDKG
ncbi:MAG: hypothetical protein ACYDDU_01860 [Dermatophilaceae bacterium]